MQDGSTIRNGYPLDLDTLTVGSRIGMMRCADATLHYFLNGVDQGMACSEIPTGNEFEQSLLNDFGLDLEHCLFRCRGVCSD